MEHVKTAFGFVILALPVFLLERIIGDDWGVRLWSLLGVAFFSWAFITSLQAKHAWMRIVQIILLAAALVSVRPLQDWAFGVPQAQTQTHLNFTPVASVDALNQALAQAKGKPVMLDLYADWCVACKEFEKYTFSNQQVQQALGDTVLLQADVTANNAQDVALLKHLQVLGLPNTVQREDVLGEALKLLEVQGIANTTLEMVAERIDYPLDELQRFWPDKEAILYDALRYLSQRVDIWRRQLLLDDTLSAEQKLLARYTALSECVSNNRYPGCLFIAACTFYPDPGHPIHQLADQQKKAAHDFTHELLTTLEVDDPAMVAKQMELVLEGCLSRMLVNRSHADVETAHRLAEDILRFAQCRMGGALT